MQTGGPNPSWANAEAYVRYVGRWSRLVARAFVDWLGAAPGGRWLDVGSGAGALTETLLAAVSPRQVLGVDRSAAFLQYARARLPDARAGFAVGDAQHLPVAGGAFDAVVSGLMLNFLPAPHQGVTELARAARPGGLVALYVWDYAGEMQMMRQFWDAAAALDPRARDLDEGRRMTVCRPEPLAQLFHAAALTNVAVQAIDIPIVFRDFDDYWEPFLGGQGPAPGYVVALDAGHRDRLREHLRARLPVAADGSIPLMARAWAVRGLKV